MILLVLAPLVGEYLLGNLSLDRTSSLAAFPVLALTYGAGFIREVARRSGRSWPTIRHPGRGLRVFEEAFVTRSLFDPNFRGLDLRTYGNLPALGMGSAWTVFVIGTHSVRSIVVPTAITEALSPDRSRAPWLGGAGLAVILAGSAFFLLYHVGVRWGYCRWSCRRSLPSR